MVDMLNPHLHATTSVKIPILGQGGLSEQPSVACPPPSPGGKTLIHVDALGGVVPP